MKYTSTRDATRFYTFEEALFSGYAPDGGLFVPTELPSLLSSSNEVLAEEWPKLGYTDLATEILHPFIGDEGMSKHDLRSLLGRALAKGFDVPNTNLVPVVPMVRTNGTNGNDAVDCYVAELFHGPTNCFKVGTIY
jgi:threonine synthase